MEGRGQAVALAVGGFSLDNHLLAFYDRTMLAVVGRQAQSVCRAVVSGLAHCRTGRRRRGNGVDV